MTKMNMVWVAVAKLLYPNTDSTVTKDDIDTLVYELFQTNITPVMIHSHLVSYIDRQADKNNLQRGGSKNRYLFKENNDRFRLYKKSDEDQDGWDKNGPYCPSINAVPSEYQYLVTWYDTVYLRL